LVGSANAAPGLTLQLVEAPLRLATPATVVKILQFKVNRLNAAYDLVAVYPGALTEAQLASLPGPSAKSVPDAEASLVVPDSRFADDFLRPRVHPMPPANWTNEPHGLIRVGDVWHMFYQRTPNGPFKTQMHWGHMSSRDLVTWSHLQDALWPELTSETFGFDMKGIWSGDVIADGGKAFAFYTSVNHGDRLAASNPGISMAVSEDADLRDWRKLGPILNTREVKDFRDPYLWKEGDSWHMVIGAALESGGGLEHLALKQGGQGPRWERQRRFTEQAFQVLDPGSAIWEMPVFEQLADGVSVLLVNPVGGKISKYGDPATRAVYWTGEWKEGVFRPFFRTPKNLDLVPGHLAPTVGRAADGRLRAIGIIDERRSPPSQERAGWANAFGLPRVWTLMPDRRTLGQAPAPELMALRGEPRLARADMKLGNEPATLLSGLHAYELLIQIDAAQVGSGLLAIDVMASDDGREVTRLLFDPAKGRVLVDKSRSTLSTDGEGPQQLAGEFSFDAFGAMRTVRVFVDGSAIEVFVNDAAAYAVRSYPSLAGSTNVRVSATGGADLTAGVQIWPLRRPPG
jgi:beta-fructofuranosidase